MAPGLPTMAPGSLQQAQDAFEAARHPAALPQVDTSHIEHGVAPVEMTGITTTEVAAAPQSGEDIEQQLFGKPTF